jgi:hypothetical protein
MTKPRVRLLLLLVAIALAVANSGCGVTAFSSSQQSASQPRIAVAISPASASLQTGGTQQFTAVVSGTSNTAVAWTATGGTISNSGFYTAPNSAGNFTVTVTSVADTTKSVSATVNVSAQPPTVSVSISPTSASLQTGGTQQFTATVSGTSNTAVTWSATGGTISNSGLYTAPNSPGSFTVKATSVADTTKSASASVTVTSASPVIAVSPTSVSFSTIPATTTSSQALVVTNSGGSTLTVSQANVSGSTVFSVTAPTFPFTLSPGQSSTVTIQFAPLTAGTYNGSLSLVSNASNTLPAIPLSGTATAPPTYLLSVYPTSLSFGSVLVGSAVTQTATLSNTGNSSVTVFSASTTGAGFSVTGVTFPFSIAAGASRSVTIRFAPQVSGAVSGVASFTSNATNSPTTISLSGTGIVPLPHSVDLAWTGSTSVVSGYNIYRGSQSGGPYTKLNSMLQPATNYTDPSVQSGLTYFYVVTAVDGAGAESANSNEATAVIPVP